METLNFIINITEILANESLTRKERTVLISKLLIAKSISTQQLLKHAESKTDTDKVTLIEAVEYATKSEPEIMEKRALEIIIENLSHSSPAIKRESARVTGNTIHLFPTYIAKAVVKLLTNTEHPGTVVRWSAAYALSQIIKCRTEINKQLLSAIESIIKIESDRAILNIYQKAIKNYFPGAGSS